jgi:hypothetical protein
MFKKHNRNAYQHSLYCSGQNSTAVAAVGWLEMKRPYTSDVSILQHVINKG